MGVYAEPGAPLRRLEGRRARDPSSRLQRKPPRGIAVGRPATVAPGEGWHRLTRRAQPLLREQRGITWRVAGVALLRAILQAKGSETFLRSSGGWRSRSNSS